MMLYYQAQHICGVDLKRKEVENGNTTISSKKISA